MINNAYCLFGLVLLSTGTFYLLIAEIVLIAHTVIFTGINYASGIDAYGHLAFAIFFYFSYLQVTLIIQILWILSALLAIIAIRINHDHHLFLLFIPHLIVISISLPAFTFLIGATLFNIFTVGDYSSVDWILALIIALSMLFVVVEVAFAARLKCRYFQFVIQRQSQTVPIGENSKRQTVASIDSSFSRRSTALVTDERLMAQLNRQKQVMRWWSDDRL